VGEKIPFNATPNDIFPLLLIHLPQVYEPGRASLLHETVLSFVLFVVLQRAMKMVWNCNDNHTDDIKLSQSFKMQP
jgi:hypothetical protein